MTPSPNYYAIIPAPVLNHSELSPSAKLFYAQITGLLGQGGYCWASNEYFAERNGVSRWSIANWVAQLTEAGFLVVKYGKDTDYQRRIYLSETLPPMRKTLPPMRKTQRPPLEKSNAPHEKNPMPPIGKTQHRVIKESSKNEVVKVSEGNAPAHQQQHGEIQEQSDTFMPSSGAARPTTFADSIWATATTGTFALALLDYDPTTADADAGYYRNRCRDWSAQNPGKPRNWIAFAAQIIGDDRTQSKLVTLNSANHDSDRHTLLTNPLTGNTTNLERVSRAAASAQRVIARRRAAGL